MFDIKEIRSLERGNILGYTFFLFCITTLFLLPRAALGQSGIPVAGVKFVNTNSPSFDRKDSIVLVLSKGTILNWVSYKKLRRNMSFIEQLDKEESRDNLLRNRYPYERNQFSNTTKQRLPGAQRKVGTSHFSNIPLDNINRVNDSTYKIFFKDHIGFLRKEAKSKVTYYKRWNRRYLRREYMERDADYLEPASKYLLIIATSNPDNLNLLDTYDKEIRTGSANFPQTLLIQKKMKSIDSSRLYGLSFTADLAAIQTLYAIKLKELYDEIKSVKDAQNAYHDSLSAQLVSHLSGNLVFVRLRQLLDAQQKADLRITGMSSDSLSLLFTLASNLYKGDKTYFLKVCRGDQSLKDVVPTLEGDAHSKLTYSLNLVNILLMYTADVLLNNSTDTGFTAALIGLKVQLMNLSESINKTINTRKEIEKNRQQIAQELNADGISPLVSFSDAGTFSQDIVTRGKLSIAPDFGLVAYGFLQGKANRNFTSVSPYLGAQVNFRPFDQSVPFSSLPRSRKGFFSPIRFSAMIGITLLSVKEEGKRDNFFSGSNFLVGFGYRLSTEIRIVAGGMLFKKYDKNYLSSKKELASTIYTGVSIDLNLRDLFNNVFGVFTGK